MKTALREGTNELLLEFSSTFKEVSCTPLQSSITAYACSQGRKLEREYGKLNLWNGDSSRLHVRKAQYKYVTPQSIRGLSDKVQPAMDGIGVGVALL